MDEKTLKSIYERFEGHSKNIFDNDITTNLMDITKRELDDIGIKYESKDYKGKERLYLYDEDVFLFRYIRSFYPNNSKLGFRIANDKMLTEKFMKIAQIRTTNSILYTNSEYNKALRHVQSKKEPLVIKPLNLMGGAGVFMNVNIDNFKYAWKECIKVQNQKDIKEPLVLVQNQVAGFEVRINITEGKTFSATLRVPSHVQGDGRHSIEALIKLKNAERKKDTFLKNKLIKINQTLENILEQKNRSLDYVLEENELCILYPQSNMVHGGENYEVTNLLNPDLLEQARNSVLAIPGLHTSGVDIIIEDFDDEQGSVIEVNKAPEFLMTYYPRFGEPYNPLNDIFKSLFIESKVNRDKIDFEDLTNDSFNVIKERFRFLYEKQKIQENSIHELMEENEKLKQQLKSVNNTPN